MGAAAASGSNIGAYSITSSVRASTPGGTSDLILSPASAELASFTKLYSRDTGEKTPPATLLPHRQMERTVGIPRPAAGSNQGDGCQAHPHSSNSVPATRSPPPVWSR